MEIFLYVVAMFGGSFQYEPSFFSAVISLSTLAAVVAVFGLPKLFKRNKA